jgi:hypothetical protein
LSEDPPAAEAPAADAPAGANGAAKPPPNLSSGYYDADGAYFPRAGAGNSTNNEKPDSEGISTARVNMSAVANISSAQNVSNSSNATNVTESSNSSSSSQIKRDYYTYNE